MITVELLSMGFVQGILVFNLHGPELRETYADYIGL